MGLEEEVEYNGKTYTVGYDDSADDPREYWDDVTIESIRGGYDSVDAPKTGELTDFLLRLYEDGALDFDHGGVWVGFSDYDDEEEIKEQLGYSLEEWDTEASADDIAVYGLVMEFVNGIGSDVEDFVDFTNKANGILGISPGDVVKSAVVRGYSQSDWQEVVVEGPSGHNLDSFVDEFRMWAFGDIYYVTDDETGDSLSGIYADTAEEAVQFFVEG